MSTNNSQINFKENENGIYVLDDSHLAERKSGILVPEDLVESKSGFLSSLRNKYLTTAAAISFLFSPLLVESNNNDASLDNLVNNIQLSETNPDDSNVVTYEFSQRGQEARQRSKQSCASLGISNIRRTQHYGVPTGSGSGAVVNLSDGMPIILEPGYFMMLDDILNINYNSAKIMKKELSNNGFIFSNDSIIAGPNAEYMVLNIKAVDNRTGCFEGVLLPVFSPNYFITGETISQTPRDQTIIIDPRDQQTQYTPQCLADRLRDDINEVLRLRDEKERRLRSAETTRNELVRIVDDYDRLRDDILCPSDEEQKIVNEKVNGQEQNGQEQKKQIAIIGGFDSNNFAQTAPYFGLEVPVIGNYEGRNFTISAIYVLPTEFDVTGEKNFEHYSNLLTSNKKSSKLEGNAMFNLGGDFNLGLGGFILYNFNEGESRIDIEALTHGGTSHINYGLPTELPGNQLMYGPSAKLSFRLLDGLQVYLKGNYDLSNNKFDKDGVFDNIDTDQYRNLYLQFGAKLELNRNQ